MAALALILGVLAAAGWGWGIATRLELEGARVSIHALEVQIVELQFDVEFREGALRAAESALRYWERIREADAKPPLTEIPAAFRQAFGEGE